MASVIEESTDLEAYYPLLPHTDDIYTAAKDRTRARAFKRLAACMIDGISYTVMRKEEIREAEHNRDMLGVFVVRISYVANIDTLLA